MNNSSKVWLRKKPESILDWILIVFACIAFYLAMGHLDIFWGGFTKILNILSPFLGGVILAYILDPIVRWFSKFVLKNNDRWRWVAILAAYVVFAFIIVLLVMLVVPQVISSVTMLMENLPGYIGNVQGILLYLQERFGLDLTKTVAALDNYEEVLNGLSQTAAAMAPQIMEYVRGVASNVVSIFTALASSIYMLAEKAKLLRQLRTMAHAFLPRGLAENILRICAMANENFTSFFTGKIVDSAIVGVGVFFIMSLLGISFAPLISVVVGITNIIPVFGPFIGAIPSIVILLFVNPIEALEFLILILVVQQIDGNFLGPKILGHSIGISALWVLFSIVVGGDLFGVVGMVLGVPVFATFYSLTKEVVDWCLAARGIDANGVTLAPEDGHFEPVRIIDETGDAPDIHEED